MIFRDRIEAGELLTEAPAQWRGQSPLIAAIPRGAVPMAKVIVDRLGGDLDVVLTRKLHAPGDPEFAIGAVDETGWTYLTEYAEQTGATLDYRESEIATERQTMRSPRDPLGRFVIVVDDGLATEATIIAALHALRAKSQSGLSVPGRWRRGCAREMRAYADEVVYKPALFYAVGHFPQVSDDEVVALFRAVSDTAVKLQDAR
jgi:predicted phosphoribosyltransferase